MVLSKFFEVEKKKGFFLYGTHPHVQKTLTQLVSAEQADVHIFISKSGCTCNSIYIAFGTVRRNYRYRRFDFFQTMKQSNGPRAHAVGGEKSTFSR